MHITFQRNCHNAKKSARVSLSRGPFRVSTLKLRPLYDLLMGFSVITAVKYLRVTSSLHTCDPSAWL